jgi:hypothetical protein
MKKYLITLLFLTFAILINAQAIGPRIVALEQEYDFGEIDEGVKVAHEFVVMNDGAGVLEIQRVKASCGCTAVKPDKNKLNPGDSTKIKVTFDSSRRKGKQKKYVYVFSNDKVNPQLRLMFKANIKKKSDEVSSNTSGPRLLLTKNQHNFGTVKKGEQLALNIHLKNSGQEKLTIDRIKSSCGCTATVLNQKELMPGENSTLEIKLDTSDRVGKFTRTVTLFSNDRANPNQTITLFVNIEERNT